jgi:hypothetical protein
MNDTDKAEMIARIMEWRRTVAEVGPAISGTLVRCGARLMADLPDDDLVELHDACEAMAELTTDGFFQ